MRLLYPPYNNDRLLVTTLMPDNDILHEQRMPLDEHLEEPPAERQKGATPFAPPTI
jgi:hypothetical protein